MLKPRIKQSHHIIKNSNGDICIGELPGTSFIVRNPPQIFLALLNLFSGHYTIQRMTALFKQSFPNVQDPEKLVLITLEKLCELNLIEDAADQSKFLSHTEMEFYDRQMLYFSQVETQGKPGFYYQEKLKKAKVAVFGMGGWGTWVSLNLALNGFGHIRIVDGDFIEASNLNRQVLYRPKHLGMSKVEAAVDSINEINPYIKA